MNHPILLFLSFLVTGLSSNYNAPTTNIEGKWFMVQKKPNYPYDAIVYVFKRDSTIDRYEIITEKNTYIRILENQKYTYQFDGPRFVMTITDNHDSHGGEKIIWKANYSLIGDTLFTFNSNYTCEWPNATDFERKTTEEQFKELESTTIFFVRVRDDQAILKENKFSNH